MRYRRLSDSGDYTFGQGVHNFLVNSPECVGQAVQTRLLLMQPEWFLDTTDGTPYGTQILGKNTGATRDNAIRRRILGTPGVLALLAYASQLVDRAYTVQATISTIYGPTTINVPFGTQQSQQVF